VGGQHIGIVFGHGPSLPAACVIRKTEIRAILGGVILAAGALIMLPGIILVVAQGLKASGVAAKATQAAGMIPGYGGAARAVAGRATARRVTERTPIGGQMGGTRTTQYRTSARRLRRQQAAESA
jgi:hypothetical protein